MNAKGRKLFRCAAGFAAVTAIMSAAYATTAMASGIGQIDAAKLLDIHAEADSSSEVVGQVMDEGHVAVDISGEDKKKLTVEDLLSLFAKASGTEFTDDRTILS